MWIFTKYGFYSAVCARQGDGSHRQPVDPSRIMVRARSRGHLEALKERFPEAFAGCEVMETSHTDYRYRQFVAKDTWRRVVDELVEEMDYDNFKADVARFGGHDAYHDSLHDVWSVMQTFQRKG